MSSAVCETQSGAVGVFDVSVGPGYRQRICICACRKLKPQGFAMEGEV